MTPDQVKQIVEQALRDWHNFPWQTWLLSLVVLGALAYLGSYFAERGKQKAVLEVLKKTTEIVEGVRSLHAAQLEDQRLTNQLRLAVLETRIRKHQEAYTLWSELFWASNDEKKVGPAVLKCQEWWNNNSLYLSKEAREAFYHAFITAINHPGLIRVQPRDNALIQLIKESSETIEQAGRIIVESVALPPIPKIDTEIDIPAEKAGQRPGTSA